MIGGEYLWRLGLGITSIKRSAHEYLLLCLNWQVDPVPMSSSKVYGYRKGTVIERDRVVPGSQSIPTLTSSNQDWPKHFCREVINRRSCCDKSSVVLKALKNQTYISHWRDAATEAIFHHRVLRILHLDFCKRMRLRANGSTPEIHRSARLCLPVRRP